MTLVSDRVTLCDDSFAKPRTVKVQFWRRRTAEELILWVSLVSPARNLFMEMTTASVESIIPRVRSLIIHDLFTP